jgi:hypothetical protein
VNISKWNPADIWAVSQESERQIVDSLSIFRDGDDIDKLNNIIDKFFDYRELVGISLKKVSRDEDVTMVINKLSSIPKYSFSGISLSADPFATSSLRIQANRVGLGETLEYMSVRCFSGSKVQNINGEIAGDTARHGKISLTKINDILDSHNLENVPTVDYISRYNDDELKDKIVELNNILIGKYKTTIPRRTSKEVTRITLVSKYQALYLSYILMKNKKTRRSSVTDAIIEEMFHYAMAIRYSGKRTPKYVKIIDNK